ncbi:MAG: metallophosphoesterase [Candidatus Curtissbacteria bacterium]
MKKILLLVFVLLLGVAAAYFYFGPNPVKLVDNPQIEGAATVVKRPIMRIGLVSDSHNDNEILKKALAQAQGIGVNFVIGLGDWSDLGTEEELTAANKTFNDSKLKTFLLPGDRDLWDSRNRGEEALLNYQDIFGRTVQTFEQKGVQFVLVDNSDIYKGISPEGWKSLEEALAKDAKLHLVFAHKTPFHPDSSHVMGEDSPEVAKQAENLINLMQRTHPCHSGDERSEDTRIDSGYTGPCGSCEPKARMTSALCPAVDGFFSGDLHFFAKFKSPDASVKITTIGAVDADRNFQGPRFGVLTIFDDYSWEVEDVEIR